MDTKNSVITEKLRNYFDECLLSDGSVGYILLIEAVMQRMVNPCMSLNDVYDVLAEKHSCNRSSVKNAILFTISEANGRREAQGLERLSTKQFVTTCVNRFSDVEL